MKALISPSEKIMYGEQRTRTVIDSETNEETTETYVYNEEIPNSARIAQIEENQFDVGGDLFWVDCNNAVTTDSYYYDTSDNTIKFITDYTPSE